MSDPKTSPSSGTNKNAKRNLPSWMSTSESESKTHGKKSAESSIVEETEQPVSRQGKEHDRPGSCNISTKKAGKDNKPSTSRVAATNFSKLLDGVVFALSGFVNPERSVLRSQALEMGAEYQPDWNSNCTLLICAFPNTPKFRQVEADCGTIISKKDFERCNKFLAEAPYLKVQEWISECYSQRKLVDIESYLMNAGKPWRKQHTSQEASKGPESPMSGKSHNQIGRGSHAKSMASSSAEGRTSGLPKGYFSPSNVKKWAVDDLNKTVSWLESQEEKPEASEIKKIAAEGILTCLEDAIVALTNKQGIKETTEQWQIIPQVVEELIKLESNRDDSNLVSKEELCREAMTCKQLYELEFSRNDSHSSEVKKKPRIGKSTNKKAEAYDSDDTIEMTEEEIELGFNTVASKLGKN